MYVDLSYVGFVEQPTMLTYFNYTIEVAYERSTKT